VSAGLPWGRRVAGGFFAVVVIVCLWGLWAVEDEYRSLASRGVPAEAVVTAVTAERARSSVGYRVEVQYRSAAGEDMRARMPRLVGADAFRVGQRVTVLHLPEEPARVLPLDDVAEGPGITPWFLAACVLAFGWVAKMAWFPRRGAA